MSAFLRRRIAHLSGIYYPEQGTSFDEADRRALGRALGVPVPTAAWEAMLDLGSVSLRDAYIMLAEGDRSVVSEFYDVRRAIAHVRQRRATYDQPLPVGMLPLASVGFGSVLVGLQGPAQGNVFVWRWEGSNRPPAWRQDVADLLVASVEMPDETRTRIMVPTSPWQRRWRELLANAPTLASWFFVRPVAASVSDFLDSIRSSPRPQLASARVSGLANDILAGHTCAIQPSGSAWVARMRHPTDPSAGTQMRVLSNEEAVSLREFCVWHDGYKARGGVDVDLPTFVGPRGLVAAATYVSPPRPAEDEVRQSMAEAIVGCAGRPRELWIDVGQTYDGAEVTLHCDGRQGDVVLEGLDFTAGALARFRDARRRGSFRSALDDVVQILSAEPLRTALARCHARNAAFQYLVTGPYDERRAARHPSLL